MTQSIATLIASIPEKFFWIAAKGRINPAEPLYAIRILNAETDAVVSQAEADTLEEAIAAALLAIPTEEF